MRYFESNVDLHRKDDFLTRVRIPTIVQFSIVFIVGYALLCTAFFASGGSFKFFAVMSFLLLALMDGVMVFSVQRSRDQMLVTEFQNALYASALSLNNQFCLITRRDGVVVHADTGFRAMYPQFERGMYRRLDEVLQVAGVDKAETDKIYKMLASDMSGKEIVSMRADDGNLRKVVLNVDPLHRPQDYLLLRGRPYVELRIAAAA